MGHLLVIVWQVLKKFILINGRLQLVPLPLQCIVRFCAHAPILLTRNELKSWGILFDKVSKILETMDFTFLQITVFAETFFPDIWCSLFNPGRHHKLNNALVIKEKENSTGLNTASDHSIQNTANCCLSGIFPMSHLTVVCWFKLVFKKGKGKNSCLPQG